MEECHKSSPPGRRKGPQAKECGWPLEALKNKETASPLELQERNVAMPTSGFKPSPLRPMLNAKDYKKINVCYFKTTKLVVIEN